MLSLKPFKPLKSADAVWRVLGNIEASLAESYVRLCWIVVSPMPIISGTPAMERHDKLWENTCFEAFLQVGNSKGYLELNISPQGNWNLYRFSRYREGMAPLVIGHSDISIELRPMVKGRESWAQIDCRLRLPRELIPTRAGLSAIIYETKPVSHWALLHPVAQPDFHDKESFTHVLI